MSIIRDFSPLTERLLVPTPAQIVKEYHHCDKITKTNSQQKYSCREERGVYVLTHENRDRLPEKLQLLEMLDGKL